MGKFISEMKYCTGEVLNKSSPAPNSLQVFRHNLSMGYRVLAVVGFFGM
jgi:hypothetical protein